MSDSKTVMVGASLYISGLLEINTETQEIKMLMPSRDAHQEIVMGKSDEDEKLQAMYGRLALLQLARTFIDSLIAASPTQPPSSGEMN